MRTPARPSRSCLRAGLAALTVLAWSGPAVAWNFADIDARHFPAGGANTGFTNAGPGFDFAIDPTLERLCTGAGTFQAVSSCAGKSAYDITLSQQLQRVRQFPQASGGQPSPTVPFVADSRWTATNTSAATYPQVLLLFTSVNLAPFPGAIAQNGYPDLPVALDGHLLKTVKYTFGGVDYFFGAVDLGRLAPGESRDFLVRYVVSGGPMPIVNHHVVMPPLRLLGVVVPEPGTLGLLATGLAGIALVGRRR